MERSSHQSLRSDRISGSPYRRPAQTDKKSSSGSFATVKSFLSYLSPFRSSSTELSLPTTISDLPVEVEEGSQSGSEDGWNGQPPTNMESADVFDLAVAAGRKGNDFDRRTAEFRSKGEIAGGRRDLARRSLEGVPASAALITPATIAAPVRSMTNGDTSTVSRRRARSPELATPQRAVVPAPSFLPASANSSASGSSASSAALAAFLDAKRGQQMSQEDLNVIDSLTRNIHVESQVGGSTATLGGWSAAMSPRVTRAMPGAGSSIETPTRPTSGSTFNTPGSAFSVGTTTPAGSSKVSPYRVRYLGPGMSPKRMLGKGTSAGGIKPLFHFNLDNEESARKKARVDEPEEQMEIEATPAPQATISSAASMPNLSSLASSSIPTDKGKAANRPHPLSQSIVASPAKSRPTAEEIGRKRAADIMLEMIQQQEAVLPKPKPEIILNPYDIPGAAVPAFSPESTRTIDSPRNSALRATGRGSTPLRGAAARIANAKSSPSKSSQPPTPVPAPKSSNTPTQNDQSRIGKTKKIAIETPVEATERSSAPSPASARPKDNGLAEASSKESSADESAPIKLFDIPSFSTPSRTMPTLSARSTTVEMFESPSQKLTLAAAKENIEQPKFTLPSLPPITQAEEEPMPSVYTPSLTKKDTLDPTKIYFTAKETALRVAEAALPFFTFTIPSTTTEDSEASKKAKEAALKADKPSFTFTMPTASATPATNGFKLPTPSSTSTSADWTCDMCMLKNPDSAKEKCTICETPRPGPKIAPVVAPAPFQWPSGSKPSGQTEQWECGLCMLKNPDSAKDKCTVCEAPRPKSTSTSSSTSVSTPFQWPSGSAPVKPKDEWTCTTCGLQNKLASENCTICDAAKP